jgi:serine/threonine-protein kinase
VGDAVTTSPNPDVLHRYCASCDAEIDAGDAAACPKCGGKLVEIRAGADETIGQVIDERFEIRALLGEGGMGTVYRAWQRSVGREVAVKLMDRRFSRDAMGVKRFLREARLASQLSQPNTVSVFDFGQAADGRLFIAMELIRGRTLFDVVSRDGKLTSARAARIGIQLCDALEAAHALKIVHRDLKLENVIVLDHPPGRDLIKVLDFGLAKSLDDSASHGTQSGVVVGTPRYMAPEAAMNGTALPAGDLYAVGVILGELVTGSPLWTETSFPALVAGKLEPGAVLDRIPSPMRELVGRLIAPDPDARPDAARTRAVLHEIMDDAASAIPGASKISPMAATVEMRTPSPAPPPLEIATIATPVRAKVPAAATAPASIDQAPVRARGWLWPALALVAAGGVVALIVLAGRGDDDAVQRPRPPAPARAPAPAPEAPSIQIAPSASPATPPVPPASPTIVLHVRTSPGGVTVLVDGHAVGPAPIDVPLPRATTPVAIGARKGDRTASKKVVPDRDRDVEIVIGPASPPPHKGSGSASDETPF